MTWLLFALALPLMALAQGTPADATAPGAFVLQQLEQQAVPAPSTPPKLESRDKKEVPKPDGKAISAHLPSAALDALDGSAIPAGPTAQPDTSSTLPQIAGTPAPTRSFVLSGTAIMRLITALLAWFLILRMARLLYCVVGRMVGLYNPDHYHLFTRLWLPWRTVYRTVGLRIIWWWEETFSYGKEATARPASALETMSKLYSPGKLYLGRFRGGGIPLFQGVGIDASGHGLVFSMTGGGKTSLLATVLSLHRGTALVIDPKGQLAKVLLRRMGDGGPGLFGKGMKVGTFDPSGIVKGVPTFCWNPFDEFTRARQRAVAREHDPDDATVALAQQMLHGLVMCSPKADPFWPGAAKDLLLSVVLWMDKTLPREQCTLERLYQLLTLGLPEDVTDPAKQTGFDCLLARLTQDQSYGGVIASGAAGLLDAAGKTSGSVLYTLREQLQWLKRPALRRVTARSDFHLDELHGGKLVLFVTCKLSDIRENYPGFFRLLSVLTMAVFEDINTRLAHPCLVALDEFGNLGKLPALETIAPYGRSLGLRLLCILQNTKQIEDAGYGNPETFMGNASFIWWLKTNHLDNLEYLHKKLGKSTRLRKLDGAPWWSLFSRQRARHGREERDVLTPDQIARFLARGNVIVTGEGRPLLLAADPYFKALPVPFYDADPDFKEGLRARTRRLMAWLFPASEATAAPLIVEALPEPAPPRSSDEAVPDPSQTNTAQDEPVKSDADAAPRPKRRRKAKIENAATGNVSRLLTVFDQCFNPISGTYPDAASRKRLYRAWMEADESVDPYSLVQASDLTHSEQAAVLKHFMEALAV